MKWEKKGLICSSKTLDLIWYKKNTMIPLPYLIHSKCLRIYLTMCDENCIGRVGFIDVEPSNPSNIISYSKKPILDIGRKGSFSEKGIVTSSLFKYNNKIYLFYSAYQSSKKVPYLVFSGVAESKDGGTTFINLSRRPLLERINDETSIRSSPLLYRDKKRLHVLYSSNTKKGWKNINGKLQPHYDIKQIFVKNPIDWQNQEGKTCICLKKKDEYGLTKPTFWKENGLYKLIYAIRSVSKGYRLGYAESTDGLSYKRRDHLVGIDVSKTGWDSEMITFPERFTHRNKTFLFYCGNQYGLAGMGYAELVKK